MRVGISNACFYSRFYTEEALNFIGKSGVKLVEVFLDTFSEYGSEYGRLLKKIADNYGLEVASVHAMSTQFEPQLFSLSMRQRDDALKLYRMVLEQGARLEAKRYVFHGPATMSGVLKNAQIERVGPIAAQLADMAAEFGIKLCWENVSWCMYNFPGFADKLLEYCDSTNLFFCFDVKQAMRSGHPPLEFVKQMGKRLEHVHLLDYKIVDQKARLCMPPNGEFDFIGLASLLNSLNYEGDAVLECYSDLYSNPEEVIVSQRKLMNLLQ